MSIKLCTTGAIIFLYADIALMQKNNWFKLAIPFALIF